MFTLPLLVRTKVEQVEKFLSLLLLWPVLLRLNNLVGQVLLDGIPR